MMMSAYIGGGLAFIFRDIIVRVFYVVVGVNCLSEVFENFVWYSSITGDSLCPFHASMFTVVLNLLLNWLFVFYFELGSHGEYCLFIYFSPDNKAFFFFWRYCSLYSDFEWTFDFRNVVGFCSKGYFLYTRFHQIEPCMVVIFSSFVTWSFFVPYADWGLIWYRNFVYFSKNAIQWCYQLCRDVLYLYPSHAGCLSWCSKSWHDTPMDRWSPLLVCSCYHGVDDISCLSSSIPDKNWKLVCSGSRCRPSTTCGQGKMKKNMSAGLYTGLFLYLVYIYVSCR